MRNEPKAYIVIADPWDYADQHAFADTVFEKDEARYSPILDQHGQPYTIMPKKNPIGFDLSHRHKKER